MPNVFDQKFLDDDPQKRLAAFADKSLAQQEIARSKNMYMDESAKGASAERLAQIHDWTDKVRGASGISNDDTIYGNAAGSAVRVQTDTPTAVDKNVDRLQNTNYSPTSYTPGAAQNGKTVDLSPLMNAINQYKPGDAKFNFGDLQNAINAGTQTGYGDIKTAMDKPNQFSLEQLQQAIGGAKTAGGGNIDIGQSRFQSPEQFSGLVNQMNALLAPQTQAQQNVAQTGFNQNMQKLRDQWASRGLLASGGAAANEQDAANGLSQTLAGIQANQQAQALPLALQYGNLGLQESGQRFGQQDSNRRFAAGQAQNNVGNLLAGMNQEQGMKQQNVGNLFNLLTNQQGQNQQKVGNVAQALGMQQGQQQDYLRNMSGALGMDMSQNQWSQQFGQQGQQNDFNRWLQTNQLNSQNSAQANNQLMDGLRLQEQQRQNNIGAVFQGSQMFGNGVTSPGSDVSQWASQFAGKPTLGQQQANNQNSQWGQQFDWTKNYQQQQMDSEKAKMDQQMAIEKMQNALGWANNGVSQQNASNTGNWQGWQMDQGNMDREVNSKTGSAVSNALSQKDMSDAAAWITENAASLYQSGVDLSALWDQVTKNPKWSPKQPAGGSGLQLP